MPKKNIEQFPVLLQKVENSLINIQQIINDLTDFCFKQRISQGEEEPLNFEKNIEDVRLALAPLVEESKAVIKTEIGVSEIVFVWRKLSSMVYKP